jgi:Domain of unknown function (DUF397)
MTGSRPAEGCRWRKSSYSAGGNCLEMALLPDGAFGVRNSDDPAHTVAFTRDEIMAFLQGVKAGEFDDLVMHHGMG